MRASLNSASLYYWAGRSYVRPAEVASPLAAHKNSLKAQIHVGPLSNWNRQCSGKLLDPLPDSSERHEGGLDRPQSFSANRTGKDAPANKGKRLADTRSIQVHPIRYSRICSSDSSIA